MSQSDLEDAAQHVRKDLTSELYDNFELFLFVSKATDGRFAQHMFAFQKRPNGRLAPLGDWPVSTGRERIESNGSHLNLSSVTPVGYYEIDPDRTFTEYRSVQWGTQMPYAMFFNWRRNGSQTGLAIHAANDDEVGQLGSRASAGCVRLPPVVARSLYAFIQLNYRGAMPDFTADTPAGPKNNDGSLFHNADGSLELAQGYKVLIVIEDYGADTAIASTP